MVEPFDQRQIDVVLAHQIARGLCGRGDAQNLVTEILQDEPELHRNESFVFDDEDTRSHGSIGGSGTYVTSV